MLTHVCVAAEVAELAADALWAAGATAVEERDNGDGTVTLVADAVPAGPWPVETVAVTEDGLDGWRPWARAWRAAPESRLVVQPTWVDPVDDARPDDIILAIDPGRSFGSGSHPTTRMVLAELEHRVKQGSLVLDVGCGSGVLAIAAARLGAGRVVALDVDAAAVRATTDNAERNGVADRVCASSMPVKHLTEGFDVVVANIGASTIIELAPALVARTNDGGALVLSGLLIDDRDRILDAAADWSCENQRSEDEWLALILRRK